MATNKITKTQEYAVLWLNHQKYPSADIAKHLKISVDDIDQILNKNDTIQTNDKAKSNMITHTSGKKINSVAIMTQAASEVGDANRKNHSNNPPSSQKGIFRPRS